LVNTFENLKRVCDDLLKCASDFKDVLSNLKVEEESLKVLNDEFKANVKRWEMTLNSTQAKF